MLGRLPGTAEHTAVNYDDLVIITKTVPLSDQTGQTGGAGGADFETKFVDHEAMSSGDQFFADDHGFATGCGHGLHYPKPVVRFVVEDAVGK